jgi:hypothetical protein
VVFKLVHTANSVNHTRLHLRAEHRQLYRISSREILLASLAALTIFTVLLLRLPYRSPISNILLSAAALSSFYFYLRLRLGIRVPALMILCLLLSLALDGIGNRFGLFSIRIGLFPYDIITHFATSGLSFVPVMWLVMTLIQRYEYRLSLGLITFFSATTTFSLGAYYEITELLDERFFGGHRIWTPRDTVQDLTADLVGIVVAAVCCAVVIRARRKRQDSGQNVSNPGSTKRVVSALHTSGVR